MINFDHQPDAIRHSIARADHRNPFLSVYRVEVLDEKGLVFEARDFCGPDDADRWAASWMPVPVISYKAEELYAALTGGCHSYLAPDEPCAECDQVGESTLGERARAAAILARRGGV